MAEVFRNSNASYNNTMLEQARNSIQQQQQQLQQQQQQQHQQQQQQQQQKQSYESQSDYEEEEEDRIPCCNREQLGKITADQLEKCGFPVKKVPVPVAVPVPVPITCPRPGCAYRKTCGFPCRKTCCRPKCRMNDLQPTVVGFGIGGKTCPCKNITPSRCASPRCAVLTKPCNACQIPHEPQSPCQTPKPYNLYCHKKIANEFPNCKPGMVPITTCSQTACCKPICSPRPKPCRSPHAKCCSRRITCCAKSCQAACSRQCITCDSPCPRICKSRCQPLCPRQGCQALLPVPTPQGIQYFPTNLPLHPVQLAQIMQQHQNLLPCGGGIQIAPQMQQIGLLGPVVPAYRPGICGMPQVQAATQFFTPGGFASQFTPLNQPQRVGSISCMRPYLDPCQASVCDPTELLLASPCDFQGSNPGPNSYSYEQTSQRRFSRKRKSADFDPTTAFGFGTGFGNPFFGNIFGPQGQQPNIPGAKPFGVPREADPTGPVLGMSTLDRCHQCPSFVYMGGILQTCITRSEPSLPPVCCPCFFPDEQPMTAKPVLSVELVLPDTDVWVDEEDEVDSNQPTGAQNIPGLVDISSDLDPGNLGAEPGQRPYFGTPMNLQSAAEGPDQNPALRAPPPSPQPYPATGQPVASALPSALALQQVGKAGGASPSPLAVGFSSPFPPPPPPPPAPPMPPGSLIPPPANYDLSASPNPGYAPTNLPDYQQYGRPVQPLPPTSAFPTAGMPENFEPKPQTPATAGGPAASIPFQVQPPTGMPTQTFGAPPSYGAPASYPAGPQSLTPSAGTLPVTPSVAPPPQGPFNITMPDIKAYPGAPPPNFSSYAPSVGYSSAASVQAPTGIPTPYLPTSASLPPAGLPPTQSSLRASDPRYSPISQPTPSSIPTPMPYASVQQVEDSERIPTAAPSASAPIETPASAPAIPEVKTTVAKMAPITIGDKTETSSSKWVKESSSMDLLQDPSVMQYTKEAANKLAAAAEQGLERSNSKVTVLDSEVHTHIVHKTKYHPAPPKAPPPPPPAPPLPPTPPRPLAKPPIPPSMPPPPPCPVPPPCPEPEPCPEPPPCPPPKCCPPHPPCPPPPICPTHPPCPPPPCPPPPCPPPPCGPLPPPCCQLPCYPQAPCCQNPNCCPQSPCCQNPTCGPQTPCCQKPTCCPQAPCCQNPNCCPQSPCCQKPTCCPQAPCCQNPNSCPQSPCCQKPTCCPQAPCCQNPNSCPQSPCCQKPNCCPQAPCCQNPNCCPQSPCCQKPNCCPQSPCCQKPNCCPQAPCCQKPNCCPQSPCCQNPNCCPQSPCCQKPTCCPQAPCCQKPSCCPQGACCQKPTCCSPCEQITCCPKGPCRQKPTCCPQAPCCQNPTCCGQAPGCQNPTCCGQSPCEQQQTCCQRSPCCVKSPCGQQPTCCQKPSCCRQPCLLQSSASTCKKRYLLENSCCHPLPPSEVSPHCKIATCGQTGTCKQLCSCPKCRFSRIVKCSHPICGKKEYIIRMQGSQPQQCLHVDCKDPLFFRDSKCADSVTCSDKEERWIMFPRNSSRKRGKKRVIYVKNVNDSPGEERKSVSIIEGGEELEEDDDDPEPADNSEPPDLLLEKYLMATKDSCKPKPDCCEKKREETGCYVTVPKPKTCCKLLTCNGNKCTSKMCRARYLYQSASKRCPGEHILCVKRLCNRNASECKKDCVFVSKHQPICVRRQVCGPKSVCVRQPIGEPLPVGSKQPERLQSKSLKKLLMCMQDQKKKCSLSINLENDKNQKCYPKSILVETGTGDEYVCTCSPVDASEHQQSVTSAEPARASFPEISTETQLWLSELRSRKELKENPTPRVQLINNECPNDRMSISRNSQPGTVSSVPQPETSLGGGQPNSSCCAPCQQCQNNCSPCQQCQNNCSPCQQCQNSCSPCQQCQNNCSPGQPCQNACTPCQQCQNSCSPCQQCQNNCSPCQTCQNSCSPGQPCQNSCSPCQPCQPCQNSCSPCQPCQPCQNTCSPGQPSQNSSLPGQPSQPYQNNCSLCQPCQNNCSPCQPCQNNCSPCQPCQNNCARCQPCQNNCARCQPCQNTCSLCKPHCFPGQSYQQSCSSCKQCKPTCCSYQPCQTSCSPCPPLRCSNGCPDRTCCQPCRRPRRLKTCQPACCKPCPCPQDYQQCSCACSQPCRTSCPQPCCSPPVCTSICPCQPVCPEPCPTPQLCTNQCPCPQPCQPVCTQPCHSPPVICTNRYPCPQTIPCVPNCASVSQLPGIQGCIQPCPSPCTQPCPVNPCLCPPNYILHYPTKYSPARLEPCPPRLQPCPPRLEPCPPPPIPTSLLPTVIPICPKPPKFTLTCTPPCFKTCTDECTTNKLICLETMNCKKRCPNTCSDECVRECCEKRPFVKTWLATCPSDGVISCSCTHSCEPECPCERKLSLKLLSTNCNGCNDIIALLEPRCCRAESREPCCRPLCYTVNGCCKKRKIFE